MYIVQHICQYYRPKILSNPALLPLSPFPKADLAVNLLYGIQMLLIPSKIVTDHFNADSNKFMNFWIRGCSVGFFAIAYVLHKSTDIDLKYKLALGTAVATGVLYPWNAKLNTGLSLPVKYPMHYVPEAVFILLTIAGIASGME